MSGFADKRSPATASPSHGAVTWQTTNEEVCSPAPAMVQRRGASTEPGTPAVPSGLVDRAVQRHGPGSGGPGSAQVPSGLVDRSVRARAGAGPGNAALPRGLIGRQRGVAEASDGRGRPAFPRMNSARRGKASTSAGGSRARSDLSDLMDQTLHIADASSSRRSRPAARLSPQDRGRLEELDDLRALGEEREALGEPDIADLEARAHELIDELGVRRGQPDAENKRRLIAAHGELPPETLEMLDRLAVSTAERDALRRQDGLRDEHATAQFASEMHDLRGRWPPMTSDQRTDTLGQVINARLRDIGVPELRITSGPMSNDMPGQFVYQRWSILLNEQTLDVARPGSDDFGQLTNAAYHEARHAEQWYLMARMLTEDDRSPDAASAETRIPLAVCESAAREPPLSQRQRAAAAVFYHSVYGDDSDHRVHVFEEIDRLNEMIPEAEQAAAASLADPRLSLRQKQRQAEKLRRLKKMRSRQQEAYEALPEEADAWQVGEAAEQAFMAMPASRSSRGW